MLKTPLPAVNDVEGAEVPEFFPKMNLAQNRHL